MDLGEGEKNAPGIDTSMCKGPVAGVYWTYLRKQQGGQAD